jgi:hypothetical protein
MEDKLGCVAFCVSSGWRPNIYRVFKTGIGMLRDLGLIKTYLEIYNCDLRIIISTPKLEFRDDLPYLID